MKNWLYIIICFSLFGSCRTEEDKKVHETLIVAGSNRLELEKVLKHYENDSLKLQAARYLIGNMAYHFTLKECFVSPEKVKYALDITKFANEDEVRGHCASLLERGYTYHKEELNDSRVLKSDFLIRNIDLAFQVWKKPWAKDVPFMDFCRYILPYRVQKESVSGLRETFMKRYIPLLDSAGVTNTFDACMLLNGQLKKEIKYKETGNPFYPTIEETDCARIGTCAALCNYGTFVMRACGIPVAVQQTIWTKMDMEHVWCAVLYNGKFYDFGPGDDQPDVYRHKLATTRYLKPAKVYRQRFDPYIKSFSVKDDGFDLDLKSPLLEDVTAEGENIPVNFCVKADKNGSEGGRKQVYLCAYNYYQWRPLSIGVKSGDSCYFERVVGHNIFIVAEVAGGNKLRFLTAPFYLNGEGNIRKFIPDTTQAEHLILEKKKEEQCRVLHYWDLSQDDFIPISCDSILSDTTQLYTRIPANALLWYTTVQKNLGQRVGFIQNDSLKRTIDF